MLFRYNDFATRIYKNVHHTSSKIKVVVSPFVHALLEYIGQTPWCKGVVRGGAWGDTPYLLLKIFVLSQNRNEKLFESRIATWPM